MQMTLPQGLAVLQKRLDAGAALIASILLAVVAVILALSQSGDATRSLIAISGVGLLTFLVGMLDLRGRVTDHGLQALLIASAIAVAATIVGTTVRVSGVALGVPVAAIEGVVWPRSFQCAC
jgi:hypothetical protein